MFLSGENCNLLFIQNFQCCISNDFHSFSILMKIHDTIVTVTVFILSDEWEAMLYKLWVNIILMEKGFSLCGWIFDPVWRFYLFFSSIISTTWNILVFSLAFVCITHCWTFEIWKFIWKNLTKRKFFFVTCSKHSIDYKTYSNVATRVFFLDFKWKKQWNQIKRIKFHTACVYNKILSSRERNDILCFSSQLKCFSLHDTAAQYKHISFNC